MGFINNYLYSLLLADFNETNLSYRVSSKISAKKSSPGKNVIKRLVNISTALIAITLSVKRFRLQLHVAASTI